MKFFACAAPPPFAPDSNFRSMSHSVVVLGNLSVKRPFGISLASDSGSCSATDTTDGERERRTSSSLAPDVRPERRYVRERSTGLLLFLPETGLAYYSSSETAVVVLGVYAFHNLGENMPGLKVTYLSP